MMGNKDRRLQRVEIFFGVERKGCRETKGLSEENEKVRIIVAIFFLFLFSDKITRDPRDILA